MARGILAARAGRLTGMIRTSSAASTVAAVDNAIRPYTEGMRSLAQQRTAAEETAKAVVALPNRTLRQLTTTEVRCPRNELLREAADLPKTTYYWSVNELVRRGLINEHREGRSTVYTLAADNRQDQILTSPTESQ